MRDLIFDVPTLITYISDLMTLEPGDLILTGTPRESGTSGIRRSPFDPATSSRPRSRASAYSRIEWSDDGNR